MSLGACWSSYLTRSKPSSMAELTELKHADSLNIRHAGTRRRWQTSSPISAHRDKGSLAVGDGCGACEPVKPRITGEFMFSAASATASSESTLQVSKQPMA